MRTRRAVLLLGLLLVASACASSRADQASGAVQSPTAAPVPTATSATQASDAAPVVSEPIRLSYGPEREQFGDLLMPAGVLDPVPLVVLVHGGFWRQQFGLGLMDPLALDLAEQGYASWNIEYRRVGGDGGWPTTGHDVAAAVEYVYVLAQTYAIDPARVVLVGHSAGGHLALWSLDQRNARVTPVGVVGLGAVVDLPYFREAQGLLGGTVEQVPEVYLDAAPVLDPRRVALVQGEADRIVPVESLAPALDAGVLVELIPGEDHFDLIDPASASWAATVELIGSYVGTS